VRPTLLRPSSRSKGKQSKKLAETGGKKQDFLGLLFDLEDGGDIFFQKRPAFSDRHGVITQKIALIEIRLLPQVLQFWGRGLFDDSVCSVSQII
jgi:hypothetical protein